MDLTSPLEAIFPSVDSAVVRVLCETSEWRTGREIASRAGRYHTAVAESLNRLAQSGVVDRSEAGRAYLFRLNDEHLAAAPLIELVRMRKRLAEAISDEVSSWKVPAQNVTLFGSAARGDGNVESDIDLLVVATLDEYLSNDDWTRQIDALRHSVTRWAGNPASVMEVTIEEVRDSAKSRAAIWRELEKDGINVFGTPIRQLRKSLR